jgi:Phage Mu protein F like protein
MQRELRERLAEGVNEGKTQAELAEIVRTEFNIAGGRAATIARTETSAAVEEARQIGRKQEAIPYKFWISSKRPNARPAHLATEIETTAKPIPTNQAFVIAGTGVTCQYPRGSGVASEDINCGCATGSAFDQNPVKAIDRYLSRGFLTYEQLVQCDAQPTNQGRDTDGPDAEIH